MLKVDCINWHNSPSPSPPINAHLARSHHQRATYLCRDELSRRNMHHAGDQSGESAGQGLCQRIAMQRSNVTEPEPKPPQLCQESSSSHKYDWNLERSRVSACVFISKPLLQREWGPTGICHRRPIIHDSNLAWPSVPPSMRLIHQRMWDKFCADPVQARCPPGCILVSSCQQQDQDETPRRWKTKRDTTITMCPGLRARLALPWRRSEHPRTRSGARRHVDLQQRQSVQSRFSGHRVGETLLDPPKLLSNVVGFFSSFSPTTFLLTDQQSHGHPAGTCPWQNNALPANPSTSQH